MNTKLILAASGMAVASSLFAQGDSAPPDIGLAELLNMEISVASKQAEKITDAAGVISVITKDEIRRFGGITLRDVLERMPSITASHAGFTERYGIASRGDQIKVTSGHNLLLINGRPTREIVEGGISSEMYAAFPINIIERIEVIRGPGSVLYGSDAFSTVINIVTMDGDNTKVAATLLGGSDGANGVNGFATLGKNDLKVTLSGRYMDKGDKQIMYSYADDNDNIITENITREDVAGSGFVDLKYKGLSLTNSYNAYNTSFFIGTDPQDDGLNHYRKNFTNLGYSTAAKDGWDMDFNVTYNYATLESHGEGIHINRKSNDLVAEMTNHIKVGSRSRLIVGALYNLRKGSEYDDALERNSSDAKINGVALYSQLDYWALDNLKLIGGFQANKIEDTDFNIVPRFGAIWYPIPKLNVKALYSSAFRAASINERYIDHPVIQGNSDLAPETIHAFDLGLNYQGEKFMLGLNYFYSEQFNIINFDYTSFPLTYQNNGEIDFHGVELEGKYFASKELYVVGSLLYQENVNQEGVENTTAVANMGGKIGISYAAQNGLTLSIFDIYQGDLGDVFESTNNPQAEAHNILNLYGSANLKRLISGKDAGEITVFCQVDNVFGDDVWTPILGADAYHNTIPSVIGRSVYFGVKVGFN
ncbi:TonB-dependent receptor plug domain-containing protein [Fulvivirga ligni]|uniref:TonB-dependent receptor plug domain-containing protein n=1 Tax=Fulvivirga ligni TaxID=2904246 RepID=UPI001F301E4C|nr:TonB-dependent receptor [Fulvivirga ligni]UII22298.1 TonB-dependent receptor [Fulvivirga ligni]